MQQLLFSILRLAALLGFGAVAPGIVAAGETAQWHWSQQLPSSSALATASSPSHRTMAEVHQLFREGPQPPTVERLVAVLGRPDGFSPHFTAGKKRSMVALEQSGGTLRFVLADGAEAHVVTPDFQRINFASRFGPGRQVELLWK